MRADIIGDIIKELGRAKKRHPNWPDHVAAQAGIVTAKSGALMDACLQKKYDRQKQMNEYGNKKKIHDEAVQLAAMAIRFLENLK